MNRTAALPERRKSLAIRMFFFAVIACSIFCNQAAFKAHESYYEASGLRGDLGADRSVIEPDNTNVKEPKQRKEEKEKEEVGTSERDSLIPHRQIPLPELARSNDTNTPCDLRKMRVIQDVLEANNNLPEIRIPKIIHQTSKTRCVAKTFSRNADHWKAIGFEYYFHDDDAMDRLVLGAGITEFLHLPLVWRNCVVQGAMKADLWRLLVLYEYGGIFADLDSPPAKFAANTILDTDEALFVVDKDGTTSFHFMAARPKHPIVRRALHIAISTLMFVRDTARCNPVSTTGPATLRASVGEFMLHDVTEEFRRQLNFEQGASLPPGQYEGRDGHGRFRVLGNPDGDINYWVNRELKLKSKRASYAAMNMSYFLDVMWGPPSNVSCLRAMWHELNQTGNVALSELVRKDIEVTCPEGMVAVPVETLGKSVTKRASKIPRMIHQASVTRCKSQSEAKRIERWTQLGYDYYLHDNYAMDRLVHSTHAFPNLPLAWIGANNDEKLLLWHYLVLWEYGGVYANIDSYPNNFGSDTVKDSDYLVMILNTTGSNFLAAMPRHPTVFLTLQDAIKDLLVGNHENARRALLDSMDRLLMQVTDAKRRPHKSDWITKTGTFKGLDQDAQMQVLDNDEGYWITQSSTI